MCLDERSPHSYKLSPGPSTLAPSPAQAEPSREVAVLRGVGAEARRSQPWLFVCCFVMGRSSVGADGGGEDDAAWKTSRSGRSWMAHPGPGDPRPAPQAGSRRAGLRSSVWARQRAPGGRGGAGTREPGEGRCWSVPPRGAATAVLGSDGWPRDPDSGAQWRRIPGAARSGLRSGAFSGTGAARMPSPGTLSSATLPPAGAQPGGRGGALPLGRAWGGSPAPALRFLWPRGHLSIGA
ncbi:uncharacterized protein LOC115276594 [Suricata suricatta]|uniref:uncharacterized protein LOC115276594 n=1 Tax=Suricata suricatta TaxID=37032 RepID=UPI001155AD6E|nr:uncharacterized protein LOC115276594 [Suricata suricatta]